MAKFTTPDTKLQAAKSIRAKKPAEPQAAEPQAAEPQAAEPQAAEPQAAKTPRPSRASADDCKALRANLNPRAEWRATQKDPVATCRPGLRQNLLIAIRGAACAVEACGLEVVGGKYTAENPYKVRMTDVGFALANGYVELIPAE